MITDILSNAGDYALSAALQFIAGILLSLPAYKLSAKINRAVSAHSLLAGLVLTVLGIALPLGPFGVLPLAIALLCAGFPARSVIPLSASNLIFNMLVPFTEISFNPDLAFLRGISAAVVGILSIFVFGALFKKNSMPLRGIINGKFRPAFEKANLIGLFAMMINEVGLFLIIGVLLNAVRNYYFSDALGTFISSDYGLTFRNFLLDRNASKSTFFMTAGIMFNTVTDLTIPAALLSYMKIRGVFLLYVIAGCVCALLMSFILF